MNELDGFFVNTVTRVLHDTAGCRPPLSRNYLTRVTAARRVAAEEVTLCSKCKPDPGPPCSEGDRVEVLDDALAIHDERLVKNRTGVIHEIQESYKGGYKIWVTWDGAENPRVPALLWPEDGDHIKFNPEPS